MRKVSANSTKFLWLGNDAAIDFINTELVLGGEQVDLLQDPEDYLAWLELAGIAVQLTVAGEQAAKYGLQVVKDFRRKLRGGLEQLARKAGLPQSVLSAVNRYIRERGGTAELLVQGARFELRPRWNVREAADYVTPIAWAFAGFLASADLRRVRRCSNPDCILFFYDTSKSGTRSWCSLDICGNKMRMAASRERRLREG